MDESSLVGTLDKLTYQEVHIANMKTENITTIYHSTENVERFNLTRKLNKNKH